MDRVTVFALLALITASASAADASCVSTVVSDQKPCSNVSGSRVAAGGVKRPAPPHPVGQPIAPPDPAVNANNVPIGVFVEIHGKEKSGGKPSSTPK